VSINPTRRRAGGFSLLEVLMVLVIMCLGAEGVEGGQGADQDIVSWELKEARNGP
jgi:prepilin-type N-terminal cleavage/methylation domain-containing protein